MLASHNVVVLLDNSVMLALLEATQCSLCSCQTNLGARPCVELCDAWLQLCMAGLMIIMKCSTMVVATSSASSYCLFVAALRGCCCLDYGSACKTGLSAVAQTFADVYDMCVILQAKLLQGNTNFLAICCSHTTRFSLDCLVRFNLHNQLCLMPASQQCTLQPLGCRCCCCCSAGS